MLYLFGMARVLLSLVGSQKILKIRPICNIVESVTDIKLLDLIIVKFAADVYKKWITIVHGLTPVCTLCAYRIYYIFTRSFALSRYGYDHRLIFSFYELLLLVIGLGVGIGVVAAVGGLAYCQMRSVLRNKTAIEDWIMAKAQDRRDHDPTLKAMVFPYDLGWRTNLRQVLSLSGNPVGDGYVWPLRPGCGTYDLTVEQLQQKDRKLKSSVLLLIKRPYSGSIVPVTFGCRTLCCPPCSGEARVAVAIGDVVSVTRSHKDWYYGVIVSSPQNGDAHPPKVLTKGWFPRACVSMRNDSSREDKSKQN
nr:zinc finger DHHC type containing 6 [Hymenolepis microstoma]